MKAPHRSGSKEKIIHTVKSPAANGLKSFAFGARLQSHPLDRGTPVSVTPVSFRAADAAAPRNQQIRCRRLLRVDHLLFTSTPCGLHPENTTFSWPSEISGSRPRSFLCRRGALPIVASTIVHGHLMPCSCRVPGHRLEQRLAQLGSPDVAEFAKPRSHRRASSRPRSCAAKPPSSRSYRFLHRRSEGCHS